MMQYVYRKCPALAKRGPGQDSHRPPELRPCQSSWVLAATLAIILLTQPGIAQIRDRTRHAGQAADDNQSQINAKKIKRGPRAIAVLEILPGGGMRLVPVALWIEGRFYDASLYGADPEPMALEPETVYEATNYGEPTGLFTVTTPKEIKGSWVANGKWKPHLALDEKLAKEAAKQPKAKAPINPDDERPILRRPGSSGTSDSSAGSSADAGAKQAPAEEDPDRPTLKKPQEPSTTASAASSSQAGQKENPSSYTTSPDENDVDRPVLRRGKPEAESSTATEAEAPPPGTASATERAQGKLATASGDVGRSYVAVSDAGPYETRSMLYAMNSEERTEKAEQMRALALAEVGKFIAARHTPALPKTAAIRDFDLRAYDLDFSNSPTLVFTATLPVAGAKAFRSPEFDYFVTVVAREDINGTPLKIFSSVTDSNHLDAFPRLAVIDAVDADANGRGDLLFRQYSDNGISYSLFRVFPYEMQKVFEGGSGV